MKPLTVTAIDVVAVASAGNPLVWVNTISFPAESIVNAKFKISALIQEDTTLFQRIFPEATKAAEREIAPPNHPINK